MCVPFFTCLCEDDGVIVIVIYCQMNAHVYKECMRGRVCRKSARSCTYRPCRSVIVRLVLSCRTRVLVDGLNDPFSPLPTLVRTTALKKTTPHRAHTHTQGQRVCNSQCEWHTQTCGRAAADMWEGPYQIKISKLWSPGGKWYSWTYTLKTAVFNGKIPNSSDAVTATRNRPPVGSAQKTARLFKPVFLSYWTIILWQLCHFIGANFYNRHIFSLSTLPATAIWARESWRL